MLLGTKESYKEGKELLLAIVLPCVNCIVASESKAKVRSSKRDFVHRSTLHVVVH